MLQTSNFLIRHVEVNTYRNNASISQVHDGPSHDLPPALWKGSPYSDYIHNIHFHEFSSLENTEQ